MPADLPTSQDLDPYNSLDGQYAVEHFLGKTLDQAQAMFEENTFLYWEDLLFMGDKAFIFYTPAYCRYLMADHYGESDALSCFASLLQIKLQYVPSTLIAIRAEIDTCLTHCIQNFDRFGVNPDIYGNLREKLITLQTALANL